MKQHNLPGPLLDAFVTLAHCGQFNLAAQRCHLSQPAFSQAIRRLERTVGTPLFDRNTRTVSLTPEGELFLPVAEQVLDSLKRALDDLKSHAEHRKGAVSIAALPAIAAEWLPPLLMDFRARHPGIALQLHDVVFERTLTLVREGVVDFAINSSLGLETEFDLRPLFEDRFFLVCRPDHPLAGKRSILLRELQGQPYVHTTRSSSVWRQLYPHLREVQLKDTGLEVSYLSTLAGLIANGAGVSVAAGVSLFHFTRLGLAAVAIRDKDLRYRITSIKRKGRSLSVAARALEDLFVSQASRQ